MKEEKYIVWSCSGYDRITSHLRSMLGCCSWPRPMGFNSAILRTMRVVALMSFAAQLSTQASSSVVSCLRKSGNTALSIHWSPVRTASHFWLNPLLQTVSLTFCKTSDFVLFAAHLQVRLVYDLINLMWKLICACVADATYSVAGRGRLVQPAASFLCIHNAHTTHAHTTYILWYVK